MMPLPSAPLSPLWMTAGLSTDWRTQRTYKASIGTLGRMNGGHTARRWAALLLTGLITLAGLTACTDEPTRPPATPTPSTTTPPTTSPSPTVTPPAAPEAAPTAKSAEAFVKYFWDVHNYAYATLDTRAFNALSEPGCTFCSSTVKDLNALRAAGSRTEGAEIHPYIVAAPPGKITTGIIVASVISQDSGQVTRRDGTTRKVKSMGKSQSYVGLHWVDNEWLVDDVAIDKTRQKS